MRPSIPRWRRPHQMLESKTGPGNDFLGWMYLPRDYDKEEFARIQGRCTADPQRLGRAGGGRHRRQLPGRTGRGGGCQGRLPQRAGAGPEDLLLRQQHQPHGAERYHRPVQGETLLDQRHLEIRHHHRDQPGIPRAAQAAGGPGGAPRKPTSGSMPPPTGPAAPSSSWRTARAGPPLWCRTMWAAAIRCCRLWACCPSPPLASTSPS